MAETCGHFVSGSKVPGTSDRFGDVYNPSTVEVQKAVALATIDEVNDAIVVIEKAFPE